MSKMKTLLMDDGFESFAINGDENRVIRFNPSDPNLIQRYNQAFKNIDKARDKIGKDVLLGVTGEVVEAGDVEEAAAVLRETDNIIRENLNYILNADVYDAAFGNQSPFCVVGRGKYLFESFLDCIGSAMKDSIGEANKASQKRMKKYLKGYKK